MQFFSHDLGIDLGTSNVLICTADHGVTIREPAVVAMDKNTGKLLQVGAAARNMLGRTPGNVVAMHPLQDGVIADHDMTVKMLQKFFQGSKTSSLFTPKPRVIISVPSSVTQMDERAVINAAIEAGARRVYLIEEPLAAALGAGLDISGPKGHLIVDIGGGTTDIAVLSMNGVATSSSIKLAGNHFDEAIARYIRSKYHVIIGQSTAEDIKIQIGSVYPHNDDVSMSVKGRDAKSGIPREFAVTSSESAPSCRDPPSGLLTKYCPFWKTPLQNWWATLPKPASYSPAAAASCWAWTCCCRSAPVFPAPLLMTRPPAWPTAVARAFPGSIK